MSSDYFFFLAHLNMASSSLNARLNAKVNMLELNAGANTLEGPGGISASRDWRPSSNPKRSHSKPSHQTQKARSVIVCHL